MRQRTDHQHEPTPGRRGLCAGRQRECRRLAGCAPSGPTTTPRTARGPDRSGRASAVREGSRAPARRSDRGTPASVELLYSSHAPSAAITRPRTTWTRRVPGCRVPRRRRPAPARQRRRPVDGRPRRFERRRRRCADRCPDPCGPLGAMSSRWKKHSAVRKPRSAASMCQASLSQCHARLSRWQTRAAVDG